MGKKKVSGIPRSTAAPHYQSWEINLFQVQKEIDLKPSKMSGIFAVTLLNFSGPRTFEQKVLQQYTHCVGFNKASSEFSVTHLNMK